MRLRADVWAAALIRRAEAAGAFAAVVQKGDPTAGDVAVKVALLDGRARAFVAQTRLDGGRDWIEPLSDDGPAPEADVDAYLARRREQDPDIWVIEVEDRQGRNFIVD